MHYFIVLITLFFFQTIAPSNCYNFYYFNPPIGYRSPHDFTSLKQKSNPFLSIPNTDLFFQADQTLMEAVNKGAHKYPVLSFAVVRQHNDFEYTTLVGKLTDLNTFNLTPEEKERLIVFQTLCDNNEHTITVTTWTEGIKNVRDINQNLIDPVYFAQLLENQNPDALRIWDGYTHQTFSTPKLPALSPEKEAAIQNGVEEMHNQIQNIMHKEKTRLKNTIALLNEQYERERKEKEEREAQKILLEQVHTALQNGQYSNYSEATLTALEYQQIKAQEAQEKRKAQSEKDKAAALKKKQQEETLQAEKQKEKELLQQKTDKKRENRRKEQEIQLAKKQTEAKKQAQNQAALAANLHTKSAKKNHDKKQKQKQNCIIFLAPKKSSNPLFNRSEYLKQRITAQIPNSKEEYIKFALKYPGSCCEYIAYASTIMLTTPNLTSETRKKYIKKILTITNENIERIYKNFDELKPTIENGPEILHLKYLIERFPIIAQNFLNDSNDPLNTVNSTTQPVIFYTDFDQDIVTIKQSIDNVTLETCPLLFTQLMTFMANYKIKISTDPLCIEPLRAKFVTNFNHFIGLALHTDLKRELFTLILAFFDDPNNLTRKKLITDFKANFPKGDSLL